MAKSSQLTRDEIIGKLRAAAYRLESALDRFYSHDLTDDTHVLEADALDISVPIRVMVHHVPSKSISLLHQLDPTYWNKPIHFEPLLSESRTMPNGQEVWTVRIPLSLSVSGGATPKGTQFTRYKGNAFSGGKFPLATWWNDICWDTGAGQVSNRDLVLALANKEGGAHVDGDVTAKYEAARRQGNIIYCGKPVSAVARIGSLVGTAGDELLEYLRINFPELNG